MCNCIYYYDYFGSVILIEYDYLASMTNVTEYETTSTVTQKCSTIIHTIMITEYEYSISGTGSYSGCECIDKVFYYLLLSPGQDPNI